MGFQVVIVTCSHKNTNTQSITLYKRVYVRDHSVHEYVSTCMYGNECFHVWTHIGIRSLLSDPNATQLNGAENDFWQFLVLASLLRSHTLYSLHHQRVQTFKQITDAFKEEEKEKYGISSGTKKWTKKKKSQTKSTSTLAGSRSFHIFIFVLCLPQLCFFSRWFPVVWAAFFQSKRRNWNRNIKWVMLLI